MRFIWQPYSRGGRFLPAFLEKTSLDLTQASAEPPCAGLRRPAGQGWGQSRPGRGVHRPHLSRDSGWEPCAAGQRDVPLDTPTLPRLRSQVLTGLCLKPRGGPDQLSLGSWSAQGPCLGGAAEGATWLPGMRPCGGPGAWRPGGLGHLELILSVSLQSVLEASGSVPQRLALEDQRVHLVLQ